MGWKALKRKATCKSKPKAKAEPEEVPQPRRPLISNETAPRTCLMPGPQRAQQTAFCPPPLGKKEFVTWMEHSSKKPLKEVKRTVEEAKLAIEMERGTEEFKLKENEDWMTETRVDFMTDSIIQPPIPSRFYNRRKTSKGLLDIYGSAISSRDTLITSGQSSATAYEGSRSLFSRLKRTESSFSRIPSRSIKSPCPESNAESSRQCLTTRPSRPSQSSLHSDNRSNRSNKANEDAVNLRERRNMLRERLRQNSDERSCRDRDIGSPRGSVSSSDIEDTWQVSSSSPSPRQPCSSASRNRQTAGSPRSTQSVANSESQRSDSNSYFEPDYPITFPTTMFEGEGDQNAANSAGLGINLTRRDDSDSSFDTVAMGLPEDRRRESLDTLDLLPPMRIQRRPGADNPFTE